MSDGLDQGRLARALHAAEPVRYAECYHGLSMSDCGIDAEDIAREYARLAAEPKRSLETPALRDAARDVIVVFRSTPASLARRHVAALDALERALVAEVP